MSKLDEEPRILIPVHPYILSFCHILLCRRHRFFLVSFRCRLSDHVFFGSYFFFILYLLFRGGQIIILHCVESFWFSTMAFKLQNFELNFEFHNLFIFLRKGRVLLHASISLLLTCKTSHQFKMGLRTRVRFDLQKIKTYVKMVTFL